MPGHAPPHAALLFEEIAGTVRPDLVLVGLFIGNDFGDAADLLRTHAEGTVPHLRERATRWLDGRDPFAAWPRPGRPRAHADLLLLRAANAGYWMRNSRMLQLLAGPWMPGLVRAGWVRQLISVSELEIRLSARQPDRGALDAFDACMQGVEDLAASCRGRGIPCAVLLVPGVVFVDETMFDTVVALDPLLDPDAYGRDLLRQRIAARCAMLDLPLLDPTDALAAVHRGTPVYHQEGHWNAEGHRTVAVWLARALRERGL